MRSWQNPITGLSNKAVSIKAVSIKAGIKVSFKVVKEASY
jgi:hypothetical protein